MSPDLNRIYRCLLNAAHLFTDSIADIEDIAEESLRANEDLGHDIDLFQETVERVERAMIQDDENERLCALALLCSRSRGVATSFNNLIASIEELAFAKQVLAHRAGNPIYQQLDKNDQNAVR